MDKINNVMVQYAERDEHGNVVGILKASNGIATWSQIEFTYDGTLWLHDVDLMPGFAGAYIGRGSIAINAVTGYVKVHGI